MDEVGFRNWLSQSGKSKKLQSDAVSRLKALQRELGACDLDEEYSKDACGRILAALRNKGENEIMLSYGTVKLPVGRYALGTYRYALNLYIHFRNAKK